MAKGKRQPQGEMSLAPRLMHPATKMPAWGSMVCWGAVHSKLWQVCYRSSASRSMHQPAECTQGELYCQGTAGDDASRLICALRNREVGRTNCDEELEEYIQPSTQLCRCHLCMVQGHLSVPATCRGFCVAESGAMHNHRTCSCRTVGGQVLYLKDRLVPPAQEMWIHSVHHLNPRCFSLGASRCYAELEYKFAGQVHRYGNAWHASVCHSWPSGLASAVFITLTNPRGLGQVNPQEHMHVHPTAPKLRHESGLWPVRVQYFRTQCA